MLALPPQPSMGAASRPLVASDVQMTMSGER
jgi:hypothetical protein